MEEKFEIESSAGIKIACRIWKEERKEYKGVVQLVHGMQEHIGRYKVFAEFLASHGYIVIGHDHLGHGNTVKAEDEYGHFSDVNGWDYLVEDIHRVQIYTKEKYPNLKYVIFGHSMGSLLVREYITKYNDNIDKVILSGTSNSRFFLPIGILFLRFLEAILGKKYKSEFIRYLVLGSFNNQFSPNRTIADWISRDDEIVDNFINDNKCLRNFTLKAYEDLLQGTCYISKQKNINQSMNIPILFVSGDEDPVGQNSKGVIKVYNKYEKINNDVTIRLIKNARHEVLNEINKEFVFEIILSWIEK